MARLRLSKIFLSLCAISFVLSIGLYVGRFKIVHYIVGQQLIPGVTIDTLGITELTPQTLRANSATGRIQVGSNPVELELTDFYLHHRWRSGEPTVIRASSLKIGPLKSLKGDLEVDKSITASIEQSFQSALDTINTSAHRVPSVDLRIENLVVTQEDELKALSGSLTMDSKAGVTRLRYQEDRGVVVLASTDVGSPDYEKMSFRLEDHEAKPLLDFQSELRAKSPTLQIAISANLNHLQLLPYLEFLPETLANSQFRLETNINGDISPSGLLDLKQHRLSAHVDLEFNSFDLELIAGAAIEIKSGETRFNLTSPLSFSANQQIGSVDSATILVSSDFEIFEFELLGLQSSLISQWYERPLSGSGRATLKGDMVVLSGVVSDPNFSNAPIELDLSTVLNGESGQVQLALNSDSASDVISLLQNIPLVPLPELKAEKGTVNLKLQSSWGQTSSVTLLGTLNQLNMITPWGEFSGIGLILGQTELYPQFRVPPSKLTFARFDPAVPITEGSMSLAVQSEGPRPILSISGFTASALGGKISVPNLSWNLASDKNEINLSLEAIDIAEVLALYPQEQVSATGKLTGKVPIISGKDGVIIKGARLQNLGPGNIKYLGALSDFGPEQLIFALTALKDYRYSKMVAGLELEANGDFLISLSLEGDAHELNKTRAVNVNLNIEENLPSLLESIRTVRGVQRMIYPSQLSFTDP